MKVSQAEEEMIKVWREVDIAEQDEEEELQAVGQRVGDAGEVEDQSEEEGQCGDYGEGFGKVLEALAGLEVCLFIDVELVQDVCAVQVL